MNGSGAFTVYRPDHRVFAGTGLKQGERFGATDRIAGYECDGCDNTFVNGRSVQTRRDGAAEDFLIPAVAPSSWAHGLKGKDPIVESITRKVLDRLSRK